MTFDVFGCYPTLWWVEVVPAGTAQGLKKVFFFSSIKLIQSLFLTINILLKYATIKQPTKHSALAVVDKSRNELSTKLNVLFGDTVSVLKQQFMQPFKIILLFWKAW